LSAPSPGVFVERRGAEPIVPMTLFRNPTFSLLLVFTRLPAAPLRSAWSIFCLFLQTTTGLSPSMAGCSHPSDRRHRLRFVVAGRLISATGRYKAFRHRQRLLRLVAFALCRRSRGHARRLHRPLLCCARFGIGLAQQVRSRRTERGGKS